MVSYKYGEFTNNQVILTRDKLRKDIFFLLLLADPKTKLNYKNYDINKTFQSVLYKLDGMNSLFDYPPELVETSSLLERAMMELNSDEFNFEIYRKLILDAGGKISHFKEV